MTYAVLTTKHHDGFALFASPHADFGVAHGVCRRDLVGEFVDAARAEGLRVGLYFSLPDWHHADYPAFTDAMRPYPMLAYPRPDPARWTRFRRDLEGQLTHLLTAYGAIDLLWFDGGWERTPDEWRAADLETLIRRLQPEIVINDRLPNVGDYDTPEQAIPTTPPARAWETCMTMSHSWGNADAGRDRKSTRYLLTVLAEVVGAGGNLLLNVSPDGRGALPDWQRDRLLAIAAWMERHGEAITGCVRGLEPGQFYGPSSRNGNRLFLFCPQRPQEFVVVRGIQGRRVESVRAIGTNRPLSFELRLSALDRMLGTDGPCDVIIATPDDVLDPMLTVLEVSLRTDP